MWSLIAYKFYEHTKEIMSVTPRGLVTHHRTESALVQVMVSPAWCQAIVWIMDSLIMTGTLQLE